MASYTPVRRYQSDSNPDVTYTVNRDENGALSCDCPRWRFARKDGTRDCKHLQAISVGVGGVRVGAEDAVEEKKRVLEKMRAERKTAPRAIARRVAPTPRAPAAPTRRGRFVRLND